MSKAKFLDPNNLKRWAALDVFRSKFLRKAVTTLCDLLNIAQSGTKNELVGMVREYVFVKDNVATRSWLDGSAVDFCW